MKTNRSRKIGNRFENFALSDNQWISHDEPAKSVFELLEMKWWWSEIKAKNREEERDVVECWVWIIPNIRGMNFNIPFRKFEVKIRVEKLFPVITISFTRPICARHTSKLFIHPIVQAMYRRPRYVRLVCGWCWRLFWKAFIFDPSNLLNINQWEISKLETFLFRRGEVYFSYFRVLVYRTVLWTEKFRVAAEYENNFFNEQQSKGEKSAKDRRHQQHESERNIYDNVKKIV